jgi:Transposase DDE domain
MLVEELVRRFELEAPVTVMVRATLENVLSVDGLNSLFEKYAERQSNKTLMFSTVADIMGMVACRIHPSAHAAFQARKEVGVRVHALYDKLQRMEPNVSRHLVKETAQQMNQIVRKTKGTVPKLLEGYRVKVLDGNHLRRTQRRIGELRTLNAAPLPGHALVILQPEVRLVTDVFPCEDGHASERSILPEVLTTVERGDLWIADRNFCTADFLLGIKERWAFFIIRQHSQSPRCELLGKPERVGRCETGMVYEQKAKIMHEDGRSMTVRRVTVRLDKPTRDGDGEIHIFTNLPKRAATALRVAELYRKRWTIETAFAEVAQNLEGEIETLGYPKAALFSFCSALVAFNLLNVVMAALRGAHGAENVDDKISVYYMADEVAHTYRGLTIALSEDYWRSTYAALTPTELARELLRIAKGVNLARYRKHKRGPKKTTQALSKKRRNHVSTARVLARARTAV